MPISTARFLIFSAIAKRSSAFFGIPFLSRVRPTTQAPYFFTRGRTFSSDSSSPFTELTIGFPLYTLRAASSTAGIVESIWRGVSVIPCKAFIVLIIMAFSSISGRPTLTSSISAPA